MLRTPARSYRTNGHGFRNAIDRASADVYLLGDSILVAGFVPEDETLTSRLERRIGRSVMNISLVGLGVQEERDLMRRELLPLENRVVIQCVFEGNDLLDSARYRRNQSGSATAVSPLKRTLTNSALVALQRLSDRVYRRRRQNARTGWLGDELYSFMWTERSFRGFESELERVSGLLGDGNLENYNRDGWFGRTQETGCRARSISLPLVRTMAHEFRQAIGYRFPSVPRSPRRTTVSRRSSTPSARDTEPALDGQHGPGAGLVGTDGRRGRCAATSHDKDICFVTTHMADSYSYHGA